MKKSSVFATLAVICLLLAFFPSAVCAANEETAIKNEQIKVGSDPQRDLTAPVENLSRKSITVSPSDATVTATITLYFDSIKWPGGSNQAVPIQPSPTYDPEWIILNWHASSCPSGVIFWTFRFYEKYPGTVNAYSNHVYTEIYCWYSPVKVTGTTEIRGLNTPLKPGTAYKMTVQISSSIDTGDEIQLASFWTAGPRPTTFSIRSSTTSPTTNVAFTLAGTLKAGTTALANQPVHLERRSYTGGAWGAWANVANTYKYTDATGTIRLSQTVSTAGTYQYRWHYTGTAKYAASYSAPLKETVKKPTTMAIWTSTTPKLNVAFKVAGSLKSGTTGLVGYSIHLDRKIGTGAWVHLTWAPKTTGIGGVIPSISQTMTTHTTYSYRWHFAGTGTYQPSYSPVKTFTV